MTDPIDPPEGSKGTPPQQPKAKPPKPAKAEATESKGKSAKDLKKEKRAAQVAARAAEGVASGSSGPVADAEGRPKSGGLSVPSSADKRPGTSAAGPSSIVPGPNAGPKRPIAQTNASYISPQDNAHASNSTQNLFFSHLPVHSKPNTPQAIAMAKLHPDVIRLGVLMSEGMLRGANSRTMAMMACFQQVIRDYDCPDQAVLWKDLPIYLSPMIAWLESCRPKGVGGGNAIRWLKSEINRLGEEDYERTETEQKAYLVEAIGVYIRDRIEFADQVIADNAKEKIHPGSTIVTFARSSVVERVLLEAWRDMREQDPEATFEVIVVDSRPLNEGRALLESLTQAGLQCTYLLLPLLSSVLDRTSLVLLGGSALHSDGALYSRAGTALVAMLAKEHRVPVVACVETYKFGERVVLDGVATNELGNGVDLLDIPTNTILSIKKPQDKPAHGSGIPNLTPLSLMYDLTPPSLITAVCTEIGFIPPSSVPTVLGKAAGGV